MKNDLISIIVPIYKVEKYLKQCLDSICNQSYRNLEIILVDDGSPDNCGKICDEYALRDKRIKVIHKENGGLSSARNAGLDCAKGEYISFIDSDDYISSNFIEKLYTLCVQNDADIAECDFLKFENDVKTVKTIEKINKYDSLEMQNRIYSLDYVRTIVVWNKLYRKYIYENLRFPYGKINEDEFTTYKAFYKCKRKIVTTNCKLYYYRYNSNSIMGKKFNIKRFDYLEALKERIQFYKEKNIKELHIKSLERYGSTLKEYYILTKQNIENPTKYLILLLDKAKEYYEQIKQIKEIKKRYKLKLLIFINFPNIYTNLYKVKTLKQMPRKVLRKLIQIKNKKKNKFKILIYKVKCVLKRQKEIFIFNTPLHGNLGDQAIIYAESKLLKNINAKGFEISTGEQNDYFELVKKYKSQNAIIAITGGGFIGSQWLEEMDLVNKVIDNFYNHKIIILPQTIYFKDDDQGRIELEKANQIFNKANDLTIFVREKYSYEFAKKNYKNSKIYLVPDVVLSVAQTTYNLERKNILLCLRKDVEGVFLSDNKIYIKEIIEKMGVEFLETDTVVDYNIKPKNRKDEIERKLKEFAASKLVVTDRLHGMIFAAITQTPCIVFSNYNYKIKGVYDWLKNFNYIFYIENICEFEKIFNKILKDDINYEYKNLNEEFKNLLNILKGDI